MNVIFSLDSHIDRLAEELGIDPFELRMKNYTVYGDQEKKIPYSAKRLDECMRVVTEAIGWERRNSFKNAVQGTKRRGIGMSGYLMPEGAGFPPYNAHADVVIKNDGSINLLIGVVDIGTGCQTIFSMIAAEELGVEADDITVTWGDTKDTPYAPSSHASRLTAEMGPAVLQAGAEARQKVFEIAAPILGAKVEELESKNGEIYL